MNSVVKQDDKDVGERERKQSMIKALRKDKRTRLLLSNLFVIKICTSVN